MIGLYYRIEECLMQLRRDAEHAAGFRCFVIEGVEGVWREDYGRSRLTAKPIFLAVHYTKEVRNSVQDIKNLRICMTM